MGRIHKVDKISGIYCIENKINEKKYIGKTFDTDYRIAEHKQRLRFGNHSNKYLQFSWNKYRENNFTFYLIQECPDELLNDLECEIIEYFNTTNRKFGYNRTEGGEGTTGHKHSEETLKIIKEKRSKQIITEEYKNKIGKAHTGKLVSQETCERISNSRSGIKHGRNREDRHVGVYFHKGRIQNPWEARITIGRKDTIFLGVFHTEQEAIKAYEDAYLFYFDKPFNESEG